MVKSEDLCFRFCGLGSQTKNGIQIQIRLLVDAKYFHPYVKKIFLTVPGDF